MNILYHRSSSTQSVRGSIILGSDMLSLWHQADGHTLMELVQEFRVDSATSLSLRAALVCLVQAGLLFRDGEELSRATRSKSVGDLVSVVIIGCNSLSWLPDCIASLSTQTYSPLEIIFVDNASSDDSVDWLAASSSHVKTVRLASRRSLAHAINQGVSAASGKFFLILNPDTQLESDAIAQIIAVAQSDPSCAAVAAKLKFMWAPAFLNGLGNRVGAFSWAIDNGSGHLDFGQLDNWREVPSACFAAALIPRFAWDKIGALDENFPLYYEDNEWCYRARWMGYTIRAAPQAIVYHAFGSRLPTENETRMNAEKLQNITYGRLRFAVKLLGAPWLARFLTAYLLEDSARLVLALVRFDLIALRAYLKAWNDFLGTLSKTLEERRMFQRQRTRTDADIFRLQRDMPAPLTWHGLPLLTWDIVQNHYLPLMLSGQTSAFPEFADLHDNHFQRLNWLVRAKGIWRSEGWRALLHRIGRSIQWRLARV